MGRNYDWTSISLYAPLYEKLNEVRGDQFYNDFLLELCERYDIGEAGDITYTEAEEVTSEWKTISVHQEVYDEVENQKLSDETFNDLIYKMLKQIEDED